jgi:hypothetical protein
MWGRRTALVYWVCFRKKVSLRKCRMTSSSKQEKTSRTTIHKHHEETGADQRQVKVDILAVIA